MKIFIVTHKSYVFPDDSEYESIQVGSTILANVENKDSTGENINSFNPSFCELTALYWIWKNNKDKIIGLVHYRRYFKSKIHSTYLKGKKIASTQDFLSSLECYDVIVHSPRNYYITSIKNHYCKAHFKHDYDFLRDEIVKQYPEYLVSFDKVMNGSSISLYNMFVGKREKLEPYFEWLFNILLSLEKKIPYKEYDNYQKRVFGFMAERLFNVWLEHNKNELNIEYRSVVNIEGENLFRKGLNLLNRHLRRA